VSGVLSGASIPVLIELGNDISKNQDPLTVKITAIVIGLGGLVLSILQKKKAIKEN
jgi:multisubunit Na+/H+ antiporter MnhC subunit